MLHGLSLSVFVFVAVGGSDSDSVLLLLSDVNVYIKNKSLLKYMLLLYCVCTVICNIGHLDTFHCTVIWHTSNEKNGHAHPYLGFCCQIGSGMSVIHI